MGNAAGVGNAQAAALPSWDSQPGGQRTHHEASLCCAGAQGSTDLMMVISILFLIYKNEKTASHIAGELLQSPAIFCQASFWVLLKLIIKLILKIMFF